MPSLFADTHNVVAILETSDASKVFAQIIDFLSGSYIHYALTVSPPIYISCIKQFWNTAVVKRSGDVTRLQALVDKKKIVIYEDVIREILQLDDAEGMVCLPNEEIFAGLAQLGYEKPTSWNEFSTAMASAVICLSKGQRFNFSRVGKGCSGVETPLFENMLEVREVDAEEEVQVPAHDDVDQENVTEEFADDVAQPTSPLTPYLKLERLNKIKSSKLRRLKKVGTSQRIESSKDLKNVFNQERVNVDIDEDIEPVVDQEKDAEIEGRQADTQVSTFL
nr:hypothetical protein [Tanacetum cinerariifolium]